MINVQFALSMTLAVRTTSWTCTATPFFQPWLSLVRRACWGGITVDTIIRAVAAAAVVGCTSLASATSSATASLPAGVFFTEASVSLSACTTGTATGSASASPSSGCGHMMPFHWSGTNSRMLLYRYRLPLQGKAREWDGCRSFIQEVQLKEGTIVQPIITVGTTS